MATLMRCNQPHWQGIKFFAVGTIRPAGHPEVIPQFFEVFEVDEPAAPAVDGELDALRARAEAAGVKVDKRWGADRIRDEIARVSSAG